MAENETTSDLPEGFDVLYHASGSTRVVRTAADRVQAEYLGYLPKDERDRRRKRDDDAADARRKEQEDALAAEAKAAKIAADAQEAAAKERDAAEKAAAKGKPAGTAS